MNSSVEINELAKAFSKMQGELGHAKKGSKNPFFKSNYSSLSDCWDVARGPLSDNGLAVMQACMPSDKNEVVIETILMHSSGQWISSVLSIPVTKIDAQSRGSALSYCRRYSLCTALGISSDEEDDDGNLASATAPKRVVRETITLETAKMIEGCNDADHLEIIYRETLATVTSQKEKDSLIAACKSRKEQLVNADFVAELEA